MEEDVKIDLYYEVRKIFADVLLSHDCELIEAAKKAFLKLQENPDWLSEPPEFTVKD